MSRKGLCIFRLNLEILILMKVCMFMKHCRRCWYIFVGYSLKKIDSRDQNKHESWYIKILADAYFIKLRAI